MLSYNTQSLQTQVQQLAHENELLKKVIRERFPETMASKVLTTCKTIDISAHFSSPSGSETTSSATSTPPATLESMDFKLIKAIQAAQRSFVITDPSLPDNPIIFASQGFLELTGYMVDDILGRNCRFLQGPKTDQKMVQTLRAGIIRGVDTSVCLLNYRANGEEFYNQVFLAALRDQSDQIINYVGVQVEVSSLSLSSIYIYRYPTLEARLTINVVKFGGRKYLKFPSKSGKMNGILSDFERNCTIFPSQI